jgi:hypothetical protein
MFRIYLYASFILVYRLILPDSGQLHAQKDPGESKSPTIQSLMFSIDYSSNTGLFGLYNTEIKQPSFTPSVSFFSKHGFDISAMVFYMGNSDADYTNSTVQVDAMAGYTFNVGKYFTIYPNYSHFFHDKASSSLKSSYTDNLQVDFTFEYKFFMSAFTGNYLIGKENNTPIVSFQNFFLIDKEEFIFNKLYVAVQPGFDISWSNRKYYKNYVYDFITSSDENKQKYFQSHPRFAFLYEKAKKEYPRLDENLIIQLLTARNISVEEEFKLASVAFILPVYLMFGDFSVNASASYYKPMNVSEYLDDSGQLYFNIGLAYILSW